MLISNTLMYSQLILIESLKFVANISSASDGIFVSLMKYFIEVAYILSYIINNSIKSEKFSRQIKLAIMRPIYRNWDMSSFESSKPISFLPINFWTYYLEEIVTIHERLLYLFDESQRGYLEGRSVQRALYRFTNTIIKLIENDDHDLGLFIDLASACDCLTSRFLLVKLEKLVVRGNTKKLIVSYLSDQQQFQLFRTELSVNPG